MGLDRFANFISKSINNECIEEIYINDNLKPIVSNNIIFDLNFLIYQEIIEVENEVNDIIKIILCLPWANDSNLIEKYIKNIFDQSHWKLYYDNFSFENILDGYNEDEIIHNFIFFITSKIPNDTQYNLSLIEFIIFEKIVDTLIYYIDKFHIIKPNNDDSFIQTIAIFFDGIPSFSKIVEQRRRRIKNYLESNEKKKIFKLYFDNLLPNNKKLVDNISKNYKDPVDNSLSFDYFKWIKNRFSIDKSFGPSCEFIKNLNDFISSKINNKFKTVNIYMSSSNENGEADIKIFKYISNKVNGDYCIHTTDSDLIHQILVQQTYYKIINKDVTLTVIKYLKNHNLLGYAQILDATNIIKNILDLYNNLIQISSKKDSPTRFEILSINNNYKIIWDLCLIFYLFGNDHLPSSLEVGPELGLEYFIITHHKALNTNTIINLVNNEITLNLNNLLLLLKEINQNKKQNISRIILQRFFKINSQLINLFTDKLILDFDEILLYLNYILHNESTQDLKQEIIDVLLENDKLINDNIDKYDFKFMGLILYNKPINITNQDYQDIYMYIIDKINNEQCKKYPKLYDHIDINYHLKILKENNNIDPNSYLKKIYHLVTTQFGSMSDYYTNNLTFYKYYTIPSINELINFLLMINHDEQITIWKNYINEENVTDYFNSINHHIIISPFLSLNKDSDLYLYNLSDFIKNIITNSTNTKQINNLWLQSDDLNLFDYRDIDIKDFLLNWNNYIEYL